MTAVKDKYKIIALKLQNEMKGLQIDAEYLCNKLSEAYCGEAAEVSYADKPLRGVVVDFTASPKGWGFEVRCILELNSEGNRVAHPLNKICIISE